MTATRIRRLGPADWHAYREIRLRALLDAPEAFGSTATDAERLTEQEWRHRLEGRATFVAVAGGVDVGLVSGMGSDRPGEAELVSMWVDPEWRAQGVGSLLIQAVLDWAAEIGVQRVRLWVAAGNVRAERLYARHGFVKTGEAQPMGEAASNRVEFAMARLMSR